MKYVRTYGYSLSYLNAEGNGGSNSAQTLNDVFIPSNKEFSIFSGQKCDESCGFSRAQDVAYSELYYICSSLYVKLIPFCRGFLWRKQDLPVQVQDAAGW